MDIAVANSASDVPGPSRSPATKPNSPVPMFVPIRVAGSPAYIAFLSITPRKVPEKKKLPPIGVNRLAINVIESVTMPCFG